jgi:predicted transcriptional regulator
MSTNRRKWTFLTNHGHVLLCLAKSPSMRMREIAAHVGITERAVQRIIADLHESGCVVRHRQGRCNVYEINRDHPLRHALEAHKSIADLTNLILDHEGGQGSG